MVNRCRMVQVYCSKEALRSSQKKAGASTLSLKTSWADQVGECCRIGYSTTAIGTEGWGNVTYERPTAQDLFDVQPVELKRAREKHRNSTPPRAAEHVVCSVQRNRASGIFYTKKTKGKQFQEKRLLYSKIRTVMRLSRPKNVLTQQSRHCTANK